MKSLGGEYFSLLFEWHILCCKECRHAVWPDQVATHLKNKHLLSHAHANAVERDIADRWPDIPRKPEDLELPVTLTLRPEDAMERIPELTLHTNGLRCTVEPQSCQYICCNRKVLTRHWRSAHDWPPRPRRGGSGACKEQEVQDRDAQGRMEVQCQRFFLAGPCSSYFQVREAPEVDAAATSGEHIYGSPQWVWQDAWRRATEAFDRLSARSTIEQGERDEVNPWLQRTGWLPYLEGHDRAALLALIQPGTGGDAVTAVWTAMAELAVSCQRTVIRAGTMLRMHAVRVEPDRSRHQPLSAYWHEDAVAKRCLPWQQMLAFFVRTGEDERAATHPPYRFTRHQRRAFDALLAAAREPHEPRTPPTSDDDTALDERLEPRIALTTIQAACLEFCVQLLNQTAYHGEYDCALVCAAAVLGVDPSTRGGWRDPDAYPPLLSAIIKQAQFMVVHHAAQLGARAPRDDRSGSSPCDFDAEHDERAAAADSPCARRATEWMRSCRQRSPLKWVRLMVDSFMVRGTDSPMEWFLDLRAYGMKIALNTTTAGRVTWKNRDELQYRDISFTMADFRGMVHHLRRTTLRALVQDLVFAEDEGELPPIPWERLYDDPSNGAIGWCFLDDKRHSLPVDGREWLSRRIRERDDVRGRFVRANAASRLDRAAVADWMRRLSAFRGRLLVLMHLSGGQPARGTEILSVRHRNSAQGGHRNLFLEDGMVVFVTRYSKMYVTTGDVKIVHRYLPRDVGALVVWYLWLVLPFAQRMEAMLRDGEGGPLSAHLWPADASERGRAPRKWTTDRMTDVMKQVSAEGMGRAIGVAAYRHIAIAISREKLRRAGAAPEEGEGDEEGGDGDALDDLLAEAADLQASHSSHVAGMVYARDVLERPGVHADLRRRFRTLSCEWHAFLGFTDIASDCAPTRKRTLFEREAAEASSERRERLRATDPAAQLTRLMGPTATLRGVQASALRYILDGASPVVAVMPTGGGKSLLFMLPAWVEPGGVTVVVVPFKGLRDDMLFRCGQLGIRCAAWDPHSACEAASIVLVTPEAAVGVAFADFLTRVAAARRLDRVVVDECHLVLHEQLGFRACLRRLGSLAGAHAQMVALTATLPPTDEDRLWERMHWARRSVRLVRASTVRPNIAYAVEDVGRRRALRDAAVVRLVGDAAQDAGGKVLVMCHTRYAVQHTVGLLTAVVPCHAYDGDLSDQRRKEILDDFRRGTCRVVVATGAFGTGVDIDDVRMVLHVDDPWDLCDYAQSSGRAGRDGLPARAIILRGGITSDDERTRRYIESPQGECRRITLDRYLDGDTDRRRCRKGEQPCDRCAQPDVPLPDDELPTGETSPVAGGDERPQPIPSEDIIVLSPSSLRAATKSTSLSAPAPRESCSEGGDFVSLTTSPPQAGSPSSGRVSVAALPVGTVRVISSCAAERAPGPAASGGEEEGKAEDEEEQRRQRRQRQLDQDRERALPALTRAEQERLLSAAREECTRRLERWKKICAVCRVRRQDAHHLIRECGDEASREATARFEPARRQIRYAHDRSVCYNCGIPPALCARWPGGRKRDATGICQFQGIVWGTVYGVRQVRPRLWEEWVARTRSIGEDGGELQFLAKTVSYADILPCCRLFDAFMWLSRRVEEEVEGEERL